MTPTDPTRPRRSTLAAAALAAAVGAGTLTAGGCGGSDDALRASETPPAETGGPDTTTAPADAASAADRPRPDADLDGETPVLLPADGALGWQRREARRPAGTVAGQVVPGLDADWYVDLERSPDPDRSEGASISGFAVAILDVVDALGRTDLEAQQIGGRAAMVSPEGTASLIVIASGPSTSVLLVSPDASSADLTAVAGDIEPTDDVTWSTP